jgi:hypothetical protein
MATSLVIRHKIIPAYVVFLHDISHLKYVLICEILLRNIEISTQRYIGPVAVL